MKRTTLAAGVLGMILALGTTIVVYSTHATADAVPKINLLRTPHDGIQPQTALARDGVLHMIYFKGDASEGDIEYVRRDPAGKDFSQPIRVNSEPGSAVP